MTKRDWKTLGAAIGFLLYGILIVFLTAYPVIKRGFEPIQIPILTISGLCTAACFYFSMKRAREFFKRT